MVKPKLGVEPNLVLGRTLRGRSLFCFVLNKNVEVF